MAIIPRRKSRKQRALETVKEGAENVMKIRLAWAGGKTAVKIAGPALVAVGAGAAIARKRAGGGPPETAAA